jgi:hypothetical protein
MNFLSSGFFIFCTLTVLINYFCKANEYEKDDFNPFSHRLLTRFLIPDKDEFFCNFKCPKNSKIKITRILFLILIIFNLIRIIQETRVRRDNHLATYNTCAAYDINFNHGKFNLYLFRDCCNGHDVCYSTCFGA